MQTHCAVIFFISRFLVEMSFHLTLRGINHEQKDAVQQLFESNGWPWNVEVTDVCKTESTAHSSRLDDIPRSPLALPLNWRPTFPLPDSRGSESAECEFCFCVPCVTTSRQSWLGTGQSAHRRNSGIRKKMYRKFWSMLEMRNSWRHPAYLQKKSAVMERDGVDESVVEVLREIMPDCVLLLVRELYPNPVGVPYLGHKWW